MLIPSCVFLIVQRLFRHLSESHGLVHILLLNHVSHTQSSLCMMGGRGLVVTQIN